ncbi:MAG: endonuclease/exonuclease/phosphatase family protein [Sphingomonas sp.]|nr:endonuclease/exonuclease/phosphatase family protein [Sphingomonas sp.]
MIRVASYNMRKAIGTDRRRRPERTLDVLNELDADVIALQEADRRFGARVSALPLSLIEAHSDYRPVPFEARDGSLGWHGNALLVRKNVEVRERHLFHLPSLEPRGAVLAEVEVGGHMLRVVGMHLDLSGLWRRRQAHAILSHLHERAGDPPTVLMGDLNEWSARGGCLRDFAHHHHFAPCGHSFHARRPVARLDRIMVTPDLDILDSGVHFSPTARRASDHLPIWADIAPGDETRRTLGPPPPRLTWRAKVSATLIRRERRIRG